MSPAWNRTWWCWAGSRTRWMSTSACPTPRRPAVSWAPWPAGRAPGRPGRRAPPAARVLPGPGEAVLATWHQLLDTGRMQDGEPFLAGTARPAAAVMSAATAGEAGTADGGKVSVTTAQGAVT